MWGCDLEEIERKWDSSAATLVEKSSHIFQEKKWLGKEGKKLILTSAGKLFAYKIAAEMFISNK